MITLLLLVCLVVAKPVTAGGLTLDQIISVKNLASSTVWLAPAARQTSRPHPLGRQILSVEKQESKQSRETRYARVYEFDYSLMIARLLIVDIHDLLIVREQPLDAIHLPLNQAEIDFAIETLAKDDALLQMMRDEQIRRGQPPFQRLSELDVKASIYEPAGMQQQTATLSCDAQRCALISLFDRSRTVFAAEPIVNLVTQQISRLGKP